jgi:hypothetical protein
MSRDLRTETEVAQSRRERKDTKHMAQTSSGLPLRNAMVLQLGSWGQAEAQKPMLNTSSYTAFGRTAVFLRGAC